MRRGERWIPPVCYSVAIRPLLLSPGCSLHCYYSVLTLPNLGQREGGVSALFLTPLCPCNHHTLRREDTPNQECRDLRKLLPRQFHLQVTQTHLYFRELFPNFPAPNCSFGCILPSPSPISPGTCLKSLLVFRSQDPRS